MTNSPKTPPEKGRRTPPTTKATKSQEASFATNKVVSQRQLSKKQREEQHQRLVIKSVAIGLILTSLAIIAGLFYGLVWVPNQVVAQVNDQSLTLREYRKEQRYTLIQQIVQNLQLAAMFKDNAQFGTQFSDRSPVLNQQAASLKDDPKDQQVIEDWEERQLIIQGAKKLNIEASQDEIDQQLAQDLALGFLSEPPKPATNVLTSPSPILTSPSPISDTMLTEGVTNTHAITQDLALPSPTPEPSPTPLPDVAREHVSQIFTKIFELYIAELNKASKERQMNLKPQFVRDDFQHAMNQQVQRRVLTEKIQKHLVPEETFEGSNDPHRIQARQILLKVSIPITDTETMTSTQTVTETQKQLDELFAIRKPEAEALVRQLREGADFSQFALEYSEDAGSRQRGGDVGFFDKKGVSEYGGTYDPLFVEAAFQLKDHDISDPVRTSFGWHIIQVTERQTTTLKDQLQKAQTDSFDTWLEEQRKTADIKLFPETTPTPLPSPTSEPTYVAGPPTPSPTPLLSTTPELGMTPLPFQTPTMPFTETIILTDSLTTTLPITR